MSNVPTANATATATRNAQTNYQMSLLRGNPQGKYQLQVSIDAKHRLGVENFPLTNLEKRFMTLPEEYFPDSADDASVQQKMADLQRDAQKASDRRGQNIASQHAAAERERLAALQASAPPKTNSWLTRAWHGVRPGFLLGRLKKGGARTAKKSRRKAKTSRRTRSRRG